ncbi:hypothetical protein LC605_22660 [Nostoc sp. CHAB 5836]|uniref:hypothetical protein n=1 Tax=Nostoc sp. CHAB 5836 TaxID=2780404 RepID=UPI001E4B3CFF|nr:hypothetical protein [Nostoc sp. CHAB 5836]MCC5617836.1 hypothetical protein [Nostoc sp. CHAB 5836]
MKLYVQIILVTIYILPLVMLLKTYYSIQQALQWWSYRHSLKLFLEASKIHEGLLQESFTIRRSLELLAQDHLNLTISKIQEYLKQADNFHHALVELSDRLFPVYIQDSLPLAIECLLEQWLTSNSHLCFHFDIPAYWRYEPVERSLIVLRALEELLILTLPNVSAPISVFISLKQQKKIGQLVVQITYPDRSTIIFYSNSIELEYLCQSFRFLTSGKCFCRKDNLKITYYFYW